MAPDVVNSVTDTPVADVEANSVAVPDEVVATADVGAADPLADSSIQPALATVIAALPSALGSGAADAFPELVATEVASPLATVNRDVEMSVQPVSVVASLAAAVVAGNGTADAELVALVVTVYTAVVGVPLQVVTPEGRKLLVAIEDRALTVRAEDRSLIASIEIRGIDAAAEIRKASIDAEDRSLAVE